MSYTIPQIPTTATTPAVDDYVELGGSTSGSRKFLASTWVLTTDPRLDNSGTVTSVQASGGATGLSFSGGPITTTGTLTLGGTLAVASGGTGLTNPSLVAGNSIAISNAWPNQTVALSGTPNIGTATGTSLALTGDASGAHFVATLTDGTYQYELVRTGTNAHRYGFAISAANGELLLDDTTSSVTRLRITTAGVATIAGGLVGTPIGASSPSTGAFTTLNASGTVTVSGTGAGTVNLSSSSATAVAHSLGSYYNLGANFADLNITAKDIIMLSSGTERGRFSSTGLTVAGTTTSTEAGTGDGTAINAATATGAGNAGVSFWTGGVNRWTNDILGTADAESIRWRKRGTSAATYMTLSTSGLTVTGGVVFAGGPSFVAGSIYANATLGLVTGAKTGSSHDYSIYNPSGSTAIMQVPTGTVNVEFGGSVKANNRLTVNGAGATLLTTTTGTLSTTGTNYWSIQDGGGERGWVGYGNGDGSLRVVNTIGTVNILAQSVGSVFSSTGLAVGGLVSATGQIFSTGANTAHGASRVMLSQEAVSTSYLSAYGADTSTNGTLSVVLRRSDGSNAYTSQFTTNGLAVSGTGVFTASTGSLAAISATGTQQAYLQLGNTGGSYYLGVDNSAGSSLGLGAYNMGASLPTGRNFGIYLQGTGLVGEFSSTGLAVLGNVGGTTVSGDASAATSKPTGTGAVLRSFASRAEDVFNVKDFGASPAASAADNMTAFNAATLALITAGGGTLEIPAGVFLLSAQWTITLTANNQSLVVRGAGAGATVLNWPNATHGLVIAAATGEAEGVSTSRSTTVQDITFATGNAGVYRALKITGNTNSGSSSATILQRLNFAGYTASKYWDSGIYVIDCKNLTITDISMVSATQAGDGILLESTDGQTGCNLNRCAIQGHDFGLRVIGSNSCEGVTVYASTFVGCNTGIFWNTTTGEEQFNVTDCHINPKVTYLIANNCERVWVTNLNGLIDQRLGAAPTVAAGSFVIGRRYKIKTVGSTNFVSIGASANTVGISFVATGVGLGTGDAYQTASIDIRGNCRQSKVTDSCIVGSAEDYAIICQSPLTSFTNNSMLGQNVGIFLDSGSNLGTAIGNQLFNTAGSARAGRCVQDNGTGNVVEYSGSVVWDPGSLMPGQQDTTTVSVPGVVFGSTVSLGVPYDLQGLTATCSVFTADIVRITLYNSTTSSTINLVSGTWRIRAITPGP